MRPSFSAFSDAFKAGARPIAPKPDWRTVYPISPSGVNTENATTNQPIGSSYVVGSPVNQGTFGGGVRGQGGGIIPDYGASIPTAYQMRQNIMNNQQARGYGFRNYSDVSSFQNILKNLKMYMDRQNAPGYGQTESGMWGPLPGTGANNPALTKEVQARLNQLMQFYQRNPQVYQNVLKNNLYGR